MEGIASKLYHFVKEGELDKVKQLLENITDEAAIAEIENSFQDIDPVNFAINCREEQLAIYLVEKGFSVTKLYQSVSARCDQWCLQHHRNGRCPSQYDAADNAASKHFHRLKELIEDIREGRRKPGEGLANMAAPATLIPHPPSEKAKMDRFLCQSSTMSPALFPHTIIEKAHLEDVLRGLWAYPAMLLPPGVKKEKPKSAACEALGLLERYGGHFVDRHGNTLLHRASNSTPAHIYVLANNGVPVNVQNNDGDTALHLAVRRDNFDVAEALIQCTADLSVRNGMGQMPVDEAEGTMKEMLEGCKPDPIQAVLTGNGSMLIKHLRHNWCSVLSVVKCGVQAALETAHPKLLCHLLKKTWASFSTYIKDGKNLLELAMQTSSDDPDVMNCCRILQEYRSTSELVHAVLSEDTKKLMEIFSDQHKYVVNIRFRDRFGKTLLSHAIDSNNFEVVKLLVAAGARVNQIRVRDKCRNQDTVPLFFKALRKDIIPDITQYLHSVQDPTEMLEKDSRGNTALLRAIEEGASEQIISWLLATQNGFNIFHRNKDSFNARELADYYGRQDIVNLIDDFVFQQRKKFFLIQLPVHFYGQENLQFVVGTQEHKSKTFQEAVMDGGDEDDRKSIKHYDKIQDHGVQLFEAAARGDLEAVKRLSVANFQDKNGYTGLIRAIVFNQVDVIKYLCTSRPVLKAIPDNCNRYPLHYAYALPDNDTRNTIIRILVERNPQLIEKKLDKDGRFPVDYKPLRGSPEINQMLHDAHTLDAYGVRGPPLGPWPEGVKPFSSEE